MSLILSEQYHSDKNTKKSSVDSVFDAIMLSDASLGIGEDELYLVIDEAMTNAMEHGNRWDPSLTITVSAELQKDFLSITIEDRGEGFNSQDVNIFSSIDNKLKRRGRGLYIIKQFALTRWNDSGNSITLEFRTRN